MTFQQVAQQFEASTGLHAQLRMSLAILDLARLRTDRLHVLVGNEKALSAHLATVARDIISLGEALADGVQRMKAADLANAAAYDINLANIASQVDLATTIAEMFPPPTLEDN